MKSQVRSFGKNLLQKESKKSNLITHDKRVCDFLYRWILKKGFGSILLFSPMSHEVNLSWLTYRLRKRRIRIYIPTISASMQKMQINLLRLPLRKGKFGLWTSSSSHCYPARLDLAIVPILGYDANMRRIGFGRGYYDRFLNEKSLEPYIIFVSRNPLFCKASITDSYDVKADMIVSSRVKTLSKKGSRNGVFRDKPYFFHCCDLFRRFYCF